MKGLTSDRLYDFCRDLPGSSEDVKWGDNLVFSVGAKMFATFHLPDGEPISFKVDADRFGVLTEMPGIRPAPYLARASWVQLAARRTLPIVEVEALIEASHALVAAKLPRKTRRAIGLES